MAHGSSAGPGGRGSAAAGLPAAGRQAKWRAPSWAGCLGREAPERGRGGAALPRRGGRPAPGRRPGTGLRRCSRWGRGRGGATAWR